MLRDREVDYRAMNVPTPEATKDSDPQLDTRCSEPVLCLSGGGFRATLFHLGSLRRLNEFALLSRLAVITSVSGGSILNGVLATRWTELRQSPDGVFDNFDEVIAAPVRAFCSSDLRTALLVGSRLRPGSWLSLLRNRGVVSGNLLAASYQSLYRSAQLSGIPAPAPAIPRFVFCATNVQTGACWHFHTGPAGRMGDFYTGYTATTGVSVAEAVAASSAFPPGFGALRLPTSDAANDRTDPWGNHRPVSDKRKPVDVVQHTLADGGVYDNLGVEPVWSGFRCVLASDAGHPFSSHAACPQWIAPRLGRAAAISMEQVGAVRKRWLVESYGSGERTGAIWTINTPIEQYPNVTAVGYVGPARELFSTIRTDLNRFSEGEIACLENHGYSLTDAAIRSRIPGLCPAQPAAFRWPHPSWSSNEDVARALQNSASRRLWNDIYDYLVRS